MNLKEVNWYLQKYQDDCCNNYQLKFETKYNAQWRMILGYTADDFRSFLIEVSKWIYSSVNTERIELNEEELILEVLDELKEYLVNEHSVSSDIIEQLMRIDGVGAVTASGVMAILCPEKWGVVNSDTLGILCENNLIGFGSKDISALNENDIFEAEMAYADIVNKWNQLLDKNVYVPRDVDKVMLALKRSEKRLFIECNKLVIDGSNKCEVKKVD